ncbi:MAG: hypothetical protein HY077_10220 [Elusimicrobia bacterium]|nr:hypothetical protein [Elusimicrobiota bacterium]
MRDPAFIHQYVVDTWTAQHADERTKPIALTFALVGLCLHARGVSGKQVQRFHMDLARRKERWPDFPRPLQRGRITATQVICAPAGAERDKAIDAWCACVWEAYRESHKAVADLLKRHGI